MSDRLQPTDEQQAILDAAAAGGTVAIAARAGTGKTSTLRMLAAARPKTKMLYIAFNKAIQVEADRSFPDNVTAKTAHALAYRQFGAAIRNRLNGPRMTAAANAKVLGISSSYGFDDQRLFTPPTQASLAMGMVARFCRSAAERIEPWMLRAPEGLSDAEERALAHRLLPYARKAWEDLTAGAKGKLKPSHDVYLKQWQLSHPQLQGWDVILYDECQDADPAITDVIERQAHAQLVAVGDSAQAIYGWRGAGDFLARVEAKHRLWLTQSWRFGQAVADEANVWLAMVDSEAPVRGNPAKQSRLDTLERPDTILCRCNAGTIDQLLAAHDQGVRVHLVGDGREMRTLAEAAERLQAGQPAGHPELVGFQTWTQVVEYAEQDPAGSDLAVAVRMIERYGADEVMRAIQGCVTDRRADLRVSTAHKAKGLEWGRVRIGTDFKEPIDKDGKPLPIPTAEAMLAYVAVTRAQDVLDSTGLAWVHAHLEVLGQLAAETVNDEIPPVTVELGTEPAVAAEWQTRAAAVRGLADVQLRQPAVDLADVMNNQQRDPTDGREDGRPGRVDELRSDLETALCLQARCTRRPTQDPVALAGRRSVEPTVGRLRAELAAIEAAAAPPGGKDRDPRGVTRSPERPSPRADPDGYLASYGMRRGDLVLVADERGRFVVSGVGRDGSLTVYRPGKGGARSFRPEWCCPAVHAGRGGKPVQVRTVPGEAKAARAAWRASHDLTADMSAASPTLSP